MAETKSEAAKISQIIAAICNGLEDQELDQGMIHLIRLVPGIPETIAKAIKDWMHQERLISTDWEWDFSHYLQNISGASDNGYVYSLFSDPTLFTDNKDNEHQGMENRNVILLTKKEMLDWKEYNLMRHVGKKPDHKLFNGLREGLPRELVAFGLSHPEILKIFSVTSIVCVCVSNNDENFDGNDVRIFISPDPDKSKRRINISFKPVTVNEWKFIRGCPDSTRFIMIR